MLILKLNIWLTINIKWDYAVLSKYIINKSKITKQKYVYIIINAVLQFTLVGTSLTIYVFSIEHA